MSDGCSTLFRWLIWRCLFIGSRRRFRFGLFLFVGCKLVLTFQLQFKFDLVELGLQTYDLRQQFRISFFQSSNRQA